MVTEALAMELMALALLSMVPTGAVALIIWLIMQD